MYGRQRSRHNVGRFTQLLTIRPSSGDQGEAGDYQHDWATSPDTSVQVRGMWRQTTQRENGMDGGKYSMAAGVWEIPWLPNMTTSHRVEFGSREYRIVGIENPEERNRELYLFVVEDEGARGMNG
jgi:hypothetical protein